MIVESNKALTWYFLQSPFLYHDTQVSWPKYLGVALGLPIKGFTNDDMYLKSEHLPRFFLEVIGFNPRKKIFSAIEDAGRQKVTCRSLSPVKTYNYNLSCAELSLCPCAFQMYSSSHSFLGLSSNNGTILNADH